VIELNGLKVRLGKREILKGISCRLPGKTIGLLGPNGAGKSTLIQTLLGFHKAQAGTAQVFGIDCQREPKRVREIIGYMPENDSFLGHLNAVTQLRILGELSGLPSRQALEKAHEVLFHVGLGEARYRPVGTYSLGMKQMAKLAQAIIHGPQLLILDEPTNGLDPAARQRMLKLIQEIRAIEGMHVLLCSHLLHDVEETCDEVVILKDGDIVGQVDLQAERRTNRRFVELEAVGAYQEFQQTLPTIGAEGMMESPGRWRIVLPPETEIQALWQLCAQHNLQVRKLTFRRDTLEEIFLKAVGHLSTPNPTAKKTPPTVDELAAQKGGH
jgi:ABC-2 type transport system ATP-binding protein